jgi:threonyl-tRNA synthetase
MFRNERSGVVGGLSRVRQMTLNDGHVFCTPDQLESEIVRILTMVDEAYRALRIPAPSYRLSLPNDDPKFVRNDGMWRRSEAVLRSTLDTMALPYEEARGEAAFYGPKIDLQVHDPQGREETLSTVQVDFHLPARFQLAAYDGDRRMQPVMVHRSIVSTMERMVASRGPRRGAPRVAVPVPDTSPSRRRRRDRLLVRGAGHMQRGGTAS